MRNDMRADMMMLRATMNEMYKGLKQVVTTIETENMKEMKAELAKVGYAVVVGKKAYRNANEINARNTNFVQIKETDFGYTATVKTWVKK